MGTPTRWLSVLPSTTFCSGGVHGIPVLGSKLVCGERAPLPTPKHPVQLMEKSACCRTLVSILLYCPSLWRVRCLSFWKLSSAKPTHFPGHQVGYERTITTVRSRRNCHALLYETLWPRTARNPSMAEGGTLRATCCTASAQGSTQAAASFCVRVRANSITNRKDLRNLASTSPLRVIICFSSSSFNSGSRLKAASKTSCVSRQIC
mmetsp:Transcript_5344/g.13103  ORF Transcript_5344/g.13103 Transcript_5344/m.13103 type:complete len:206 (-) Transcript_5344:1359-1976(-)